MKYFQKLGIVHRDLKPDNIIISEDPRTKSMKVKIIDFGFATYINNMKSMNDESNFYLYS